MSITQGSKILQLQIAELLVWYSPSVSTTKVLRELFNWVPICLKEQKVMTHFYSAHFSHLKHQLENNHKLFVPHMMHFINLKLQVHLIIDIKLLLFEGKFCS